VKREQRTAKKREKHFTKKRVECCKEYSNKPRKIESDVPKKSTSNATPARKGHAAKQETERESDASKKKQKQSTAKQKRVLQCAAKARPMHLN